MSTRCNAEIISVEIWGIQCAFFVVSVVSVSYRIVKIIETSAFMGVIVFLFIVIVGVLNEWVLPHVWITLNKFLIGNLVSVNQKTVGDFALFDQLGGCECVECGCCSYICPAKRRLTQSMKTGRREALALRRKKKA